MTWVWIGAVGPFAVAFAFAAWDVWARVRHERRLQADELARREGEADMVEAAARSKWRGPCA